MTSLFGSLYINAYLLQDLLVLQSTIIWRIKINVLENLMENKFYSDFFLI